MSFTEFTYQLLQGYDFVHLRRQHGVEVQVRLWHDGNQRRVCEYRQHHAKQRWQSCVVGYTLLKPTASSLYAMHRYIRKQFIKQ